MEYGSRVEGRTLSYEQLSCSFDGVHEDDGNVAKLNLVDWAIDLCPLSVRFCGGQIAYSLDLSVSTRAQHFASEGDHLPAATNCQVQDVREDLAIF